MDQHEYKAQLETLVNQLEKVSLAHRMAPDHEKAKTRKAYDAIRYQIDNLVAGQMHTERAQQLRET